MDLKLKGRVAVVTGASAGLGRGIATVLAGEGVQLAIVARRRQRLEEVADEAVRAGAPRPLVVVADLFEPSAPDRIAGEVLKSLGRVDILVNNAGFSQPGALVEPEEKWQRNFMINFTAFRRMAEVFLPSMQQNRYGRIINIGGVHEPFGGVNISGSAKAAVQFWAKALSREVARDGITINTIIPRSFVSEQPVRRGTGPGDQSQQPRTREELQKYVEEIGIPVGTFAEPEEMGDFVAFLVSPRARYITGDVIYMDGGWHRFAY